jgi:hypothetical protein
MGKRAARPHLGSDPDRLHQLLLRHTVSQRGFSVAADAVRALRYVRYRDGDDLLDLGGKRSIGEDLAAERLECLLGLRSERTAVLGGSFPSGYSDLEQSPVAAIRSFADAAAPPRAYTVPVHPPQTRLQERVGARLPSYHHRRALDGTNSRDRLF